MTAVECLKELQAFLQKNVANTIKLRKEGLSTEAEEFVHPYVALLSLPHKNFMPVNFQVPNMIIGIANGLDGADEHTINIRMQFATIGASSNFQETENIPESDGYIDLLNLMERTKEKLVNAAVIGSCVIEKSFDYGIYNEQLTYPYCYGYMNFTMQVPITNRKMKEFI